MMSKAKQCPVCGYPKCPVDCDSYPVVLPPKVFITHWCDTCKDKYHVEYTMDITGKF